MYEYLNETSEFINKKLLNNNSVLVVCEDGNQKSASIIAAYLIKYGKISLKNAISGMRTNTKPYFIFIPSKCLNQIILNRDIIIFLLVFLLFIILLFLVLFFLAFFFFCFFLPFFSMFESNYFKPH